MSDFFRRLAEGTVFARSPDDGGAPAADPAADASNQAGGDPADNGTPSPDAVAGAPDNSSAALPAGTADDGAAPPATSAAQPDRAQQRMNQLVAERWAERRRAEEAEGRNRLLQEQLNQTREALTPQVDANGQPIAPTAPPARREAPQDLQRMAQDIAAQNDFNRQVGDEVQKGRTSHQDFDQVAANLQRFGELPRTFVEAALATGKGADVMYHLGGDIAEADRILSMPPIQQAVALATLAQTIKPTVAKVVTSAPNPVSPKVGGGKTTNTPSLDDDNMSTEAWIALREKQLAAKKGEQRSARR